MPDVSTARLRDAPGLSDSSDASDVDYMADRLADRLVDRLADRMADLSEVDSGIRYSSSDEGSREDIRNAHDARQNPSTEPSARQQDSDADSDAAVDDAVAARTPPGHSRVPLAAAAAAAITTSASPLTAAIPCEDADASDAARDTVSPLPLSASALASRPLRRAVAPPAAVDPTVAAAAGVDGGACAESLTAHHAVRTLRRTTSRIRRSPTSPAPAPVLVPVATAAAARATAPPTAAETALAAGIAAAGIPTPLPSPTRVSAALDAAAAALSDSDGEADPGGAPAAARPPAESAGSRGGPPKRGSRGDLRAAARVRSEPAVPLPRRPTPPPPPPPALATLSSVLQIRDPAPSRSPSPVPRPETSASDADADADAVGGPDCARAQPPTPTPTPTPTPAATATAAPPSAAPCGAMAFNGASSSVLLPVMQRLGRRDLYTCLFVNRRWSRSAARTLYQRLPVATVDSYTSLLTMLIGGESPVHPYASYVTEWQVPASMAETIEIGDLDIGLQLFGNLRSVRIGPCPTLTNVFVQGLIDHVPRLQVLTLRGCAVSDALLVDLVAQCPRLTTLDLAYTHVSAASLIDLVQACPTLRLLDLEGTRGPARGAAPRRLDLGAVGAARSPLQSLNLTRSGVTDLILAAALPSCARLDVVVLEGCAHLTDAGVLSLATHCPRLTSLDLGFCRQLTDLTLAILGARAPCLASLVLSGCLGMTPSSLHVFVRQLVAAAATADAAIATATTTAAPRLRELVLHACPQLEGSIFAAYGRPSHPSDGVDGSGSVDDLVAGLTCILRADQLQRVATAAAAAPGDVLVASVTSAPPLGSPLRAAGAAVEPGATRVGRAEHDDSGLVASCHAMVQTDPIAPTALGMPLAADQKLITSHAVLAALAEALTSPAWPPPHQPVASALSGSTRGSSATSPSMTPRPGDRATSWSSTASTVTASTDAAPSPAAAASGARSSVGSATTAATGIPTRLPVSRGLRSGIVPPSRLPTPAFVAARRTPRPAHAAPTHAPSVSASPLPRFGSPRVGPARFADAPGSSAPASSGYRPRQFRKINDDSFHAPAVGGAPRSRYGTLASPSPPAAGGWRHAGAGAARPGASRASAGSPSRIKTPTMAMAATSLASPTPAASTTKPRPRVRTSWLPAPTSPALSPSARRRPLSRRPSALHVGSPSSSTATGLPARDDPVSPSASLRSLPSRRPSMGWIAGGRDSRGDAASARPSSVSQSASSPSSAAWPLMGASSPAARAVRPMGSRRRLRMPPVAPAAAAAAAAAESPGSPSRASARPVSWIAPVSRIASPRLTTPFTPLAPAVATRTPPPPPWATPPPSVPGKALGAAEAGRARPAGDTAPAAAATPSSDAVERPSSPE
ncbi:hypothetical protein CXG81DRAFT_27189 [Caulochytrium protostelioides]|uniref:F-box domain-containing protein n=1 Tax=Caulochytrium protostelioides TaxID=1555241 RepID=A0A4P9X4S4_9FUNG|nr:hypothetical protein CXG81DRAFT_27189 [Caulochytrium protostelioides]|eukprot:RKP00083.1 hypothetical protein CXG81DRAFT_27189 [Caulochytrium protostelioides]